MSDFDLTSKQKQVIDLLPASKYDIASELKVSPNTSKTHIEALRNKGIDVEYDFDSGQYFLDDFTQESVESNRNEERNLEPQRINSYHKAQKTKEVNNTLTEIELEIKEALEDCPIYTTDFSNSPSKSTLVIPHSDSHFGAKIQKRSINHEFTTEIAKQRVNELVDDAIGRAKERGDVEDVVFGLFGDLIEGENIFPNQIAKLDEFLREQIHIAAVTYVNQIEKLSNEFDNVKIVTCPGNHGRTSGVTNADDIVFDEIELGLKWKELDNVEVIRSNGKYVNFYVRDYKAYARHGQDALSHASTSSGNNRWMNWKEESREDTEDDRQFDVAYHGHHHQLRLEPVGHSQVVQCGTPVPPSLFVNSIGETGIPRVMYHFTTDERYFDDICQMSFV